MKKILLLAASAFLACGSAFSETVVYDFTNFQSGATAMAQWPEIGPDWVPCNPAKGGEPRTITNANTSITFAYNGGTSAGQFRASVTKGTNNLQLGKSMMFTITPTEENYIITQAVIQGNRTASPSCLVEDLTTPETSGTLVYDAATKTTTWTAAAPGAECIIDATAGAYIESITLTLDKTELKPAELAWSELECTVVLGEEYNFPTLSRATDAPVNYSSSNEEIATVNTLGEISVLAPGTTKITAYCAANATFDWGEASFTLTVMPEGNFTTVYDFTKYTGEASKPVSAEFPEITNSWWTTNPDEDKASYSSGNHFTPLTIEKDKTKITFTAEGGHGNVRMAQSTKQINLQLGAGSVMTISTADNYSLVSVQILGNTKVAENRMSTVTSPAESGTAVYDPDTKILTWTPADRSADCVLKALEGAYLESITIDYLKTPIQSGVSTLTSDSDTPVVYYNLQGIRVENPAQGLFIRRKGNLSEKVLIR